MSSLPEAGNSFLCIDDYEVYFVKNADNKVLSFIHSGCSREETFAENTAAFSRFKIRPRMLRGVSPCDLGTSVLGRPVTAPIGISPLGLNKLAHLDGETAVAKAAEAQGWLYTLSVNASTTIEDVAKATPNSFKWFQMYSLNDRSVSASLIRRAEDTGYSAIVLTVDNIFKGLRYRTQRDPVVFDSVVRRVNYDSAHKDNVMGFGKHYSMYEQSVSWETVDWIRTITKLPVIIKGIQTGEDAALALEHGVSAVWVSNHGGRQVDSVRPTIEVLPEVSAVVSGRCEIYLDGGVRTGGDVLKALALGANMVFIGRPILYGLFQGGQKAVANILDIIKEELESVMMLSGCCKVKDISPSMVTRSCCCGSVLDRNNDILK